jgi:hypothetical protein
VDEGLQQVGGCCQEQQQHQAGQEALQQGGDQGEVY